MTEQDYLTKIDNATVTEQQDKGFNAFKKAYEDGLNIEYYSFGRWYAEWCREEGLFNDTAIDQVDSFQ